MRIQVLYILLIFSHLLLMCDDTSAQSVEKVHVHTDKENYHAGEIIWFRIDVLDAQSDKPLDISKIVYAELLDAANLPVLQGKIAIESAMGEGSFFIPVNMRSGRYTFRAYTSWMKNFPADHFFQKNISIYNIKSAANTSAANSNATKASFDQQLKIDVQTDKKIYSTREKIRLETDSRIASGMSVSVYRLDSLQSLPSDGIADNTDYKETLNSSDEFLPEYDGHIITGRIIDERTGRPARGISCYLFVPGYKHLLAVSTSDTTGTIRFNVKEFYGVNEIMVEMNSMTDSNYRFEIKDPFSNQYTTNTSSPFVLPASHSTLLDQSISAQVQLIYNGRMQNEFLVPAIDSMPFYGNPDISYLGDDYVKFETMEEVLREYVVPVGLQRRNGKLYPFIYDALRRKAFTRNPLIFVDGIPIFDMDKFMAIDPSIISRINVVDCKYFLGRNIFEGIIDIDTKINYIDSTGLDKNAMILNYEGLQLKRKFYSPVYETQEQRSSRLPDFRNVLYWSPDIKTNENGKSSIEFYSSDLKGKFAIVVHGITAEGKTGSNTSFIEVR